MPAYTPNMKLAKPYESDRWDVNVLNANFDIIDSFPYVVESGQTTAYHSNINCTVAQYKQITWYYKKWSDGTLEAYAVAHIPDLACNDKQGQDGTWRSGWIRFVYPALGQKVIFNRGAWLSQADNTDIETWIADTSAPGDGSENASYQTIRCISTIEEPQDKARDKNFYLSFKGTWK